MANKRKIRVFANANGKNQVIESEATTWGELKSELGGLADGNVEAVVKGTRNTLNLDDAALPVTEFTVFLVAKKMKSGGRAKRQDALTDLGKKELKTLAKHFNLTTTGDAPALLKRLRNKQKSLGKDFTKAEVNKILGGATKAEDAKVAEPKAVPAKEEVKEVAEVMDKATDGVATTNLTVEEAKVRISDVMNKAKADLISIVDAIQATTVTEAVDLFEGLESEWKEIQDAVRRKG